MFIFYYYFKVSNLCTYLKWNWKDFFSFDSSYLLHTALRNCCCTP